MPLVPDLWHGQAFRRIVFAHSLLECVPASCADVGNALALCGWCYRLLHYGLGYFWQRAKFMALVVREIGVELLDVLFAVLELWAAVLAIKQDGILDERF